MITQSVHSYFSLSSSLLKQRSNFIHTWHMDEYVRDKTLLQILCLGKGKRTELVLLKGSSHCTWPEMSARWPVSMCVLAGQPVPHVVLPHHTTCCRLPSRSGKTPVTKLGCQKWSTENLLLFSERCVDSSLRKYTAAQHKRDPRTAKAT